VQSPKISIRTGLIGTALAALCCFTPLLVIVFGVFGLSALVGYLDNVLLPALVIFIVLTLDAVRRNRQHKHTSAAANSALNTGDKK
jgi:uncharacterized membrane protein